MRLKGGSCGGRGPGQGDFREVTLTKEWTLNHGDWTGGGPGSCQPTSPHPVPVCPLAVLPVTGTRQPASALHFSILTSTCPPTCPSMCPFVHPSIHPLFPEVERKYPWGDGSRVVWWPQCW